MVSAPRLLVFWSGIVPASSLWSCSLTNWNTPGPITILTLNHAQETGRLLAFYTNRVQCSGVQMEVPRLHAAEETGWQ